MKRNAGTFGRFRLPIILVLLVIAVAALTSSGRTDAHAFLDSSDPAANAVLADTPTRISMRFTEPIEHTASTKAELFDQNSNKVDGTSVVFDPSDKSVMNLVMPDRLNNGTYTVVWQTLSAADGHEAQGYLAFTIGTVNDIASVVPPELSGSATVSIWFQSAARWIAYIGLAMVIGIWPMWLLVFRPAISPAWQAGPRLTRRIRALGYWGVVIGLFGSLLALFVQIDNARGDESWLRATTTTLTDTRYGRIWIARCVLFLVAGFAYMSAAWWWPRRQRLLTAATLAICAVLPIPFALMSHASAQTNGRTSAIAADAIHLLSASIWIGGLIALAFGLFPTLRDLTPAGRRIVLKRAIPRFSAVALSCWVAIAITGFYAGWLQVGNWKALRSTAYGTTLTVKLILAALLLILAAFNFLIVSRKIKRSEDDASGRRWTLRFMAAVAAEVALVLAVLLVVGRLTSQAPARESLAQAQNQYDAVFNLQDRKATLSIAPARTEPNHYRLVVGGDPLPADTEAVLRVTVPNDPTIQHDIALERVAGNAFEWHGSEMSVVGEWPVDVIVRKIGSFNDTANITVPIKSSTSSSGLPRAAWSFAPGGIIGLLMIIFGFAACIFGWWAGRGPLRKEGFGLGAVAIVLGVLLLVQARISVAQTGINLQTTNPIPADNASIQRGSDDFAANCTKCHGVNGKGDGPLALTFDPPAADFTTAHAKLHLDAEFFNWIRNGKPGTSMPSFSAVLSDNQIWDVINYLRYLQKQSDLPATPVASPVASPTAASATPVP